MAKFMCTHNLFAVERLAGLDVAFPVSTLHDKSISYWLASILEGGDTSFSSYMPEPYTKCREVPGSEAFPPATSLDDALTSVGTGSSSSNSVTAQSMSMGFMAWGICCFIAIILSFQQQARSRSWGWRTCIKAQPVESTLSSSPATTDTQTHSSSEASTAAVKSSSEAATAAVNHTVEPAGPSLLLRQDDSEMLPQLVEASTSCSEMLPQQMLPQLVRQAVREALPEALAEAVRGSEAARAREWVHKKPRRRTTRKDDDLATTTTNTDAPGATPCPRRGDTVVVRKVRRHTVSLPG